MVTQYATCYIIQVQSATKNFVWKLLSTIDVPRLRRLAPHSGGTFGAIATNQHPGMMKGTAKPKF